MNPPSVPIQGQPLGSLLSSIAHGKRLKLYTFVSAVDDDSVANDRVRIVPVVGIVPIRPEIGELPVPIASRARQPVISSIAEVAKGLTPGIGRRQCGPTTSNRVEIRAYLILSRPLGGEGGVDLLHAHESQFVLRS